MADDHLTNEEMLALFEKDAGAGIPKMTDRDMACGILPNLDYENQLVAISGLLRRNRQADGALEAERKEIDDFIKKSSGSATDQAVEEWGMNFYASIYQGAAHSMAALGMIAPLFESMFYQGFQGIRTQYFGVSDVPPDHARSAIVRPDEFWDCHNYYSRRKREIEPELALGIKQLAGLVGLEPLLPADLHNTLQALFAYRNQMFHNGFEWPKERCAAFAARITSEKWERWFSWATHGDAPWICDMTDEFIDHCLEMVGKVLNSFGAYSRGRHDIVDMPVSNQ